MSDEQFNRWLDASKLTQTNPYPKNVPIWLAWQAAKRDRVVITRYDFMEMFIGKDWSVDAIEAKLKENQ